MLKIWFEEWLIYMGKRGYGMLNDEDFVGEKNMGSGIDGCMIFGSVFKCTRLIKSNVFTSEKLPGKMNLYECKHASSKDCHLRVDVIFLDVDG